MSKEKQFIEWLETKKVDDRWLIQPSPVHPHIMYALLPDAALVGLFEKWLWEEKLMISVSRRGSKTYEAHIVLCKANYQTWNNWLQVKSRNPVTTKIKLMKKYLET